VPWSAVARPVEAGRDARCLTLTDNLLAALTAVCDVRRVVSRSEGRATRTCTSGRVRVVNKDLYVLSPPRKSYSRKPRAMASWNAMMNMTMPSLTLAGWPSRRRPLSWCRFCDRLASARCNGGDWRRLLRVRLESVPAGYLWRLATTTYVGGR